MKRLPLLAILLLASAASVALAGCRYDPVQQDIIDNLGDEKGTPSASHRPGEPCLACHTKYGGATPELAVAGTVYALDATMTKLVPAKNVRVTIVDSSTGGSKRPCTNAAGNFQVTADDWMDIVYPLSPNAGGTPMHSLIGRDGSCASCHRLPDMNSIDKITGASRDSAGAILVDATQVDPTCNGGGP
jgi:hypothetical protein